MTDQTEPAGTEHEQVTAMVAETVRILAVQRMNEFADARDQLQARIDKALELHSRGTDGSCKGCGLDAYEEPIPWPCATARVLNGEPASPQASTQDSRSGEASVQAQVTAAKQCQYQIIPGTEPDERGLCIATATDGDFCKTHAEAIRAKIEPPAPFVSADVAFPEVSDD